MRRLVLNFVVIFLVIGAVAQAQVTTKLTGGKLSNAVLVMDGAPDPCAGVAVGDPCPNGVLYAGSNFAGLGEHRYMTTPGHCSGFVNNYTEFTPTCTGETDAGSRQWAKNSGTTAYGVNTGATSTTDGQSNTRTLAVNYTDTEVPSFCERMVYPAGGYDDWYLPARNELQLILYAMYLDGKGNFSTAHYE